MIRLLLVDDETVTRNGLLKHIPWNALGIDEVRDASDAIEALKIAEDMVPDIVVSDVKMPGMEGTVFCENLIKRFPDCKILFISGYSNEEYLKAAIKLHALNYVEKPININELKEELKKAVDSCLKDKKVRDAAGEKCLEVNKEESSKQRTINQIKQYIDGHYSQELTVKAIAEHVFLSPAYLSYLFKSVTDTNLNEYITGVRVEKSKEFLINKRIKLFEVAKRVGYNDPNYYAKVFKRITGLTPSAYREKYV
jgi:two-component system response regulator YesN